FTPRVQEALQLHNEADLHALIDISDGLARDLHHLCEESGCGAVLHAEQIPISDDARRMPDSKPPLEHALGDGEDFELLMAVSEADARSLLARQPISGITMTAIGRFVESGVSIQEGGKTAPLPSLGYVHE